MMQPFSFSFGIGSDLIVGKAVKKQAKKKNETIYGARSLKRQLPVLRILRPTKDWDVYSSKPKRSAKQLATTLNKTTSTKNKYYTKPAIYANTTKVMNVGLDGKRGTSDDIGIADYTKPDKTVKTVTKNGIRYSTLGEIKKDRRKAINDPGSQFRHEKDKDDLFLIEAAEYGGLIDKESTK